MTKQYDKFEHKTEMTTKQEKIINNNYSIFSKILNRGEILAFEHEGGWWRIAYSIDKNGEILLSNGSWGLEECFKLEKSKFDKSGIEYFKRITKIIIIKEIINYDN